MLGVLLPFPVQWNDVFSDVVHNVVALSILRVFLHLAGPTAATEERAQDEATEACGDGGVERP